MAHRLLLQTLAMIHGLPSSMQALLYRHDLIANNLANASTAGYKADDVVLMTGAPPADALAVATSGMEVIGARGMALWTDFSQGPTRETGRELDAAIDGPGFFVVQTPLGPRYTRAGAFAISREGFLVTANGYQVLGDGGPIAMRSAKPVITPQGEVQDEGQVVGRLQVVDFSKPYRLLKQGDSLFAPADPADAAVTAVPGAQVLTGTLEESNVSAMRSMGQMIALLRHYESLQRVIQSADDIDKAAANDIGRV